MAWSTPQAARISGCTRAQLAAWSRAGLVGPEPDRYSFRDLVALRVVRSLLEGGLELRRARRALKYLVESGEDLAGLRLVTDGRDVIACRDDGQILDALRRGQLALFVSVDLMATEVEHEVAAFDAERSAFVADLEAAGDAGPNDEAAPGVDATGS